jgi:hypothetical protein
LTLIRAADAIAAAEKGLSDQLPNVRGESEASQAGQREHAPPPPSETVEDLGRTPEESRDIAGTETPGPQREGDR